MSFIPGSNEPINETILYHFKNDHRNNSPKKSQWSISCNIEHSLAQHAVDNLLNIGNNYYNVLSNDMVLQIVGYSTKQRNDREPLKICKFIQNQNILHGYPANHMMNLQDIPPNQILIIMKSLSLINDREHKLIRKGQPI